jgi:cellulose synthase operon protein C
MPVSGLFPRFPAALALVFLLAACQSTEEKAAGHFASAQSLLEEGDTPRALVELRNALALQSDLHAARKTLADLLLASGDLAGAYQQYTELAELQPNDLESRIALATILLSQSVWSDFGKATTEAQRINAIDPRVVSLILARDYQQAVTDNNTALRASVAGQAAKLRADRPDDPALLRIAIDQAISENRAQTALPLIEQALAQQPKDFGLQDLKLRLLLEQGAADAIVAQFRLMIGLFPTDTELPANLLQWYLSRSDFAGAETFLRERAGAPTADVEGHLALIDFLRGTKGPDAALAEIAPLITANADDPKADLYRALQASITFETGDRQVALTQIADLIANAPASDQTRRIKALYAGMLTSMGDQPKAETIVAEILAEDASHVEALLLRAGWRISADLASDAVIDLRTALNQDPNNARILAALAAAYLRDGSVDLATETLGKAVEVAPLEPSYARDYGRLLQDQGRAEVARSVLYQAWQSNPADLGLVEMLSEIALNTADWTLAGQLLALLRSSEAPEAQSAANQLESAVLLAQDRVDEALAIFDREIAKAEDPAQWTLLKVEALLASERPDEAAAMLSAAIEKQPDARPLLYRQALLDEAGQRPDDAIAIYRTLLASDPADERAVRSLYVLLEAQGQSEEAGKVLDAGLAAQPQSVDLRWMRASRLQAQGDVAGAIGIYETLYAENSANPLIANNLASLLSQTVDDAATLDRAFRIARRFRTSEVPALQDTYGWLLHLTGDSAGALPKLQAAAAALTEDASVQYHYGAVLAALGRTDEAKVAVTRALDLAVAAPWPGVDRARALLQELDAPKPQP